MSPSRTTTATGARPDLDGSDTWTGEADPAAAEAADPVVVDVPAGPAEPTAAPSATGASGGPVVVCRLDDLEPERGAAALVHGRQVALFRLVDGSVHAVDHRDPATGANVLARGLLGTRRDGDGAGSADGHAWYVASPLLKHRYRLDDGRCLDDDRVSIAVHRVDVVDDEVLVTLASCS